MRGLEAVAGKRGEILFALIVSPCSQLPFLGFNPDLACDLYPTATQHDNIAKSCRIENGMS